MLRLLRTICGPLLAALMLLAGPGAAVAETSHDDRVLERATELYGHLVGKNIRHHRIRDDIEPYFETHEVRSNFLIRLAREVSEAGFSNSRPKEVSVRLIEVDTFYGTAETEAELKGRWFLWFNRSFTRVDTWTLVNDQWYLDAPPLRNLDFR